MSPGSLRSRRGCFSGARPDIDFIEFNPPASYLIYVPAASIARLLGVQSESVLIGLIAGSVAFSTWAAG